MIERDERPLGEVQFALDVSDPAERARITVQIRSMLALLGVKVAQDIVELGCTGLVLPPAGLTEGAVDVFETMRLHPALESAIFIRQNMAGSICGLPCYVPPDRFCLVHNTVGALQLQGNADGPQLARHPEGVPLCSRELTEEEAKAVGVIRSKLLQDAEAAAKDLGYQAATDVDGKVKAVHVEPAAAGGLFVCPEHSEFNPACRFCLAQAVAEGPLDPDVQVDAYDLSETLLGPQYAEDLPALLADARISEIRLYVRAARWVRKLTRER